MKNYISVFLIAISTVVFSQTTDGEKFVRTKSNDTIAGWKNGGIFNVGISQTSLNNWAAGGQSSIAINSLLSVFAKYKRNKTSWENMLDVGYGMLQQGNNKRWLKTDDKIDFASKFGHNASKNWYYAALLNFKTQLTPGYNFVNDTTIIKISDFLAPGYLLGAIGMDYKPNDGFNVFIAPLTGKVTIVNNQALADKGAFGVVQAVYDPVGNLITSGKTIRSEFGGYIRMMWKKEIMKNVTFQTRFDAFSNYMKNPGNIDINWETLISMKVNKYISATINTQLIYDNDINISVDKNNDGIVDGFGPRTQFKEVLSVGFSYKF